MSELPDGFRIQTFDQLGSSPIEPYAVGAAAELMQAGLLRTQVHHWDDRAIAIMHGDQVAAFICWKPQKWLRAAFISLGATLPAYRRQGLYRRLFEALCDHLRANHPELDHVSSGYHVGNLASAAMHEALGRRVVSQGCEFPLRDGGGA